MWEFVDQIWHYFEKVLTPLGVILLAMVIWGEVKSHLTRKRMGIVLDAKDLYNEKLTEKTLGMAVGYEKLTGLLEKILRGQDEVSRQD